MKGSSAEVRVLEDQVGSRFRGEWQRRDMEAKTIDILQAAAVLESPWRDGFQGAGERERREVTAAIVGIGLYMGDTFWHFDFHKPRAVFEGTLRDHLGMPLHRCQMGTLSEQQGAKLFYTLRNRDGRETSAVLEHAPIHGLQRLWQRELCQRDAMRETMVGDIDNSLWDHDGGESGTMGKALRRDPRETCGQDDGGEIGTTCKGAPPDGVHTIGNGDRSKRRTAEECTLANLLHPVGDGDRG